MAVTQLANVNFASAQFKEGLGATFTDQLRIYNDLLRPLPDAVVSPNDKGYYVSLPNFNAISDSFGQITAGGTLTPVAMSTYLERAAWLSREIAIGSEQMVAIVAGLDPIAEAANQFGTLIAKEVQSAAISALTGIFATALLATHVLDDSGNVVSAEKLLAAKLKIGDAMDMLGVMLCNSKVYGDMITKSIAIQSGASTESYTSGQVGRALGMAVMAEDALTLAGGIYKTYLAAPGAVGYKFRYRPQQSLSAANIVNVATDNGVIAEFETSRQALTGGGTDVISCRVSFLVHPFGMQFAESANPTNAALATGSNWTKVVSDDKLIKMVQYISA